MPTLTILRGVSGSGKSTWVQENSGDAVVVSRDRVRFCLFGTNSQEYYNRADWKQREAVVTQVESAAISAALKSGLDVISDNTNIEPSHVYEKMKAAMAHDAQILIKIFCADLAVCLERNAQRARAGGHNVPDHIIVNQYNRFQETKAKGLFFNLPEQNVERIYV